MTQKEEKLLKKLCREIAEEDQQFDRFFQLLSNNFHYQDQDMKRKVVKSNISDQNQSRWKRRKVLH
jgi:hypothetical protein